MAGKRAAVGVILGSLGVLLLVGVASANEKKKMKPKAEQEPPPSDDDVEMTVVDEDGNATDIVVSTKEEEAATSAPEQKPKPKKSKTKAKSSKKAEEEAPEVVVQEEEPAEPRPRKRRKRRPVQEEIREIAEKEDKTVKKVVEEIIDEALPPGPKISELTDAETSKEMDPHGTVALGHLMLARENAPEWKEDLADEVEAWQRKVALKPDGMFGPASATRMAQEVGILPLVRYWPRSFASRDAALKDYRGRIEGVITELSLSAGEIAEPHIYALRRSMDREKAVSFGVRKPEEQPTLKWVNSVLDGIKKKAQEKGLEDLAS